MENNFIYKTISLLREIFNLKISILEKEYESFSKEEFISKLKSKLIKIQSNIEILENTKISEINSSINSSSRKLIKSFFLNLSKRMDNEKLKEIFLDLNLEDLSILDPKQNDKFDSRLHEVFEESTSSRIKKCLRIGLLFKDICIVPALVNLED